MKAMFAARFFGWTAIALFITTGPTKARADDAGRAHEARGSILELDLAKAHAILDDLVSSDPEVSLERGRLALYEGDYDRAAAILSKPELARSDAGAELLAVSEGGARATAGAVLEIDTARGVNIRFQDESDAPLAPFLADVATAAREALVRDLKVELPRPLRIELVRDLFTLAAMTGLPESAAQKTGTVAVAKWGRVTMISPRAIPHGYPWADTLAHEMAHLAQTRASRERAPLWLQEGVAKRQETRWRAARPLDDFPAADAMAAVGLDKGLGRPIDKLGGSIALLPTAEHAMVAFAEVSSFVRFWIQATSNDALPELLVRLRTAQGDDYVDTAMKGVTGNSLSEWNVRWLTYLGGVRHELPRGARLGEAHPHGSEVQRGLRLGSLLLDRAHPDAARQVLEPAQKLVPFDPLLRHHLAQALLALGRKSEAETLISRMEDVHSEFGPWMALHGAWLSEQGEGDRAAAAFATGLQLCPLSPEVACEAKSPPDLPPSPPKRHSVRRPGPRCKIDRPFAVAVRFDRVAYQAPASMSVASFAAVQILRALPRTRVSRAVGRLCDTPLPPGLSRAVVSLYVRAYGIDLGECQPRDEAYESFDQFFTRELKPGLRTICPDAQDIASPADGTIEAIGPVDREGTLLVKKQRYTVADLIGDSVDSERYAGGQFAIVYLSPRDYHRVHAPVDGQITRVRSMPGDLYPVNAIGERHVPLLFSKNRRVAIVIDTPAMGRVTVVMVGAIIVGRITVDAVPGQDVPLGDHVLSPAQPIRKGEQIGIFHLGSTAIVFVERGSAARFARATGPIRLGQSLAGGA